MRDLIKKILKEEVSSNIYETLSNEFQTLLDKNPKINELIDNGIITGIKGFLTEETIKGIKEKFVKFNVILYVPHEFLEDKKKLKEFINNKLGYKDKRGFYDNEHLEKSIWSPENLLPLNLEDRIDKNVRIASIANLDIKKG